MPPYCAAEFSGLLGRAAKRPDINCVTLKGVSSPEIILSNNGMLRIGGALATSYRCVLLRPTHIHSASRGSILQEARAGVTDSLLAGDGPSVPVTSPSSLSPGPCHLHSAHISINKTTLQHQTTLQHRPLSAYRLPSTVLQHTSTPCSLLSLGMKKREECKITFFFSIWKTANLRGSI